MVIQRWQSLLLFISVALMAIFSVSDYGKAMSGNTETFIAVSQNTGYWIYNIIIAIILFISIFMFKNLGAQKCLVILSALMMGGSAIWGFNYLHQMSSVSLTYSWILLIVAFGLTVISYFLIAADQRLLKSYDRLR